TFRGNSGGCARSAIQIFIVGAAREAIGGRCEPVRTEIDARSHVRRRGRSAARSLRRHGCARQQRRPSVERSSSGKQARGAESWDVTPDAKQITFHLRKGVMWHNARELTSDDVKYSLLRVRDPKIGSGQYTAQSKQFTTVDTPDKYTVTLKADTPQPLMFDL